jgi:hypothetical protein
MMLPHRLAFLNFSNRTNTRGRPQRVFSVTVPDPLPVREPEASEVENLGVAEQTAADGALGLEAQPARSA